MCVTRLAQEECTKHMVAKWEGSEKIAIRPRTSPGPIKRDEDQEETEAENCGTPSSTPQCVRSALPGCGWFMPVACAYERP